MQYRSADGKRRPLFPSLMLFPAACFIVTLLTDLAYARTADMTWETFSIWLLTIGLVAAGIFIVIGLIQAFGEGRWPPMILRLGYGVVLILALINAFVHSRDAYTSVVPTGLTLSIVTLLVLLVTWVLEMIPSLERSASAPSRSNGVS